MLYEISMKACLFYHCWCMGSATAQPLVPSLSPFVQRIESAEERRARNLSQRFTRSATISFLQPASRSQSDPNLASIRPPLSTKETILKRLGCAHRHDLDIIEVKKKGVLTYLF